MLGKSVPVLFGGRKPAAYANLAGGALPSWISFARAGTGWYFDSAGTLQSATTNTPRFDYSNSNALGGLLLEGARTNSIRNNTMVGASAGTPGVAPTNWTTSGALNNLTQTIVGTGSENGINYFEITIAGTPNATNSFIIRFETLSGIAASNGQNWVTSFYHRVTGGSLANITLLNVLFGYSGSATTETSTLAITPTSAALNTQRTVLVRTLNNASTAFVVPQLQINFTSGQAVNVTLRIGLPQTELLSSSTQTASSPILTTGTALTRAADIATIVGVPATILAAGEGAAIVETTQTDNGVSGVNQRIIGAGMTGYPIFKDPSGLANSYNGTSVISTASLTWTGGARAAVAWNSSGRSVVATGKSVASDISVFGASGVFTLGSLSGLSPAEGWYTRAAFYNKRLPDALLASKCVMGAPL